MWITNCSLNLSYFFLAMKFCFWHCPFYSRYCRIIHTEKQTLKSLDMHVGFSIFLTESDLKGQQAQFYFGTHQKVNCSLEQAGIDSLWWPSWVLLTSLNNSNKMSSTNCMGKHSVINVVFTVHTKNVRTAKESRIVLWNESNSHNWKQNMDFFIRIISPQSFCISVTVLALSIIISVAMQSLIGISKAYIQYNPANLPDPLGEYKLR